jgi:hypothetical protein
VSPSGFSSGRGRPGHYKMLAWLNGNESDQLMARAVPCNASNCFRKMSAPKGSEPHTKDHEMVEIDIRELRPLWDTNFLVEAFRFAAAAPLNELYVDRERMPEFLKVVFSLSRFV